MNRLDKIAVIIGITEAIKQYGVPSKFCPTIAILVGALLGYAENPTSQGILEGVMWGATTTGGYAVVKRAGGAVAEGAATSAPVLRPEFNETVSEDALEHDLDRGV